MSHSGREVISAQHREAFQISALAAILLAGLRKGVFDDLMDGKPEARPSGGSRAEDQAGVRVSCPASL